MPRRVEPFVVGEYYHIFNHGIEEKNIFSQTRDYRRFLSTFYYYQFSGPKVKFSNIFMLKSFVPDQNKKLVEILCYCLMPNHFHFLVQQLKEGGVSKFIGQLCNSYTKYFNIKYRRVGPLLRGEFEAVRIEKDEQLIHLSRYIHLNPVVSGIAKNFDAYQWYSYREYIKGEKLYCSTDQILSFFPNRQGYLKFLNDQSEYGMTLELLKHSVIDEI